MQTKKRARPVKFGKDVDKKEPKVSEEAVSEEKKESEVKETEVEEEKVVVKEEKIADDTAVASDDDTEPMEVKLSVEPAEEPSKEAATEEESETKEESTPSVDKEETTVDQEATEEPIPSKPAPFGSFTYDREARAGRKSSFRNFFVIAFFAFLVGLASMAGVSYLLSGNTSDLAKIAFQQETPTPLPTKEPAATPTPEKVDLSAYTINVLNGSGLTGEAAKAKSQLIEAGFKVGSVGNADTSDYTKTTITAQKDVHPQYLNELITLLKETYKVNSVVENSSKSGVSEVIVTLGSDKAE